MKKIIKSPSFEIFIGLANRDSDLKSHRQILMVDNTKQKKNHLDLFQSVN